MTALQATQRGHGTLLQEHEYPQLLSLRLQGGGNALINTSYSAVEAPTLTEVVTAGYRPDLSAEPKSDRFITYPLHDGQAGELRAALAKPSYCDVIRHSLKKGMERQTPPVSPPVPDPTPFESKKDSARPQWTNSQEPEKDATGSSLTLPRDYSAGKQLLLEDVGVETYAKDNPPTPKTTNPVPKPILTPLNPTSETPDIYLRTPDGIPLTELDAQWEHNPYAQECSDTSGFLGLKPGHYQLKGNIIAHDLCSLAQSDFYSQFFQICPKVEPNIGSEPSFSPGKVKVIINQRRSASRLRALLATEPAKREDIRPTTTASRTTPSQPQEKTRARKVILEKRKYTQEPTLAELVVPPRDEDLYYKNGQLKPGPTARIPKRGPTSKERKRPRNRNRDRRREHSWTSKVLAPNEPNPRTPKKLIMGEELLQLSNPACYKRPDLPTQHTDPSPEEPGMETGAACFGPQTLLLVQNPMNQATYDSGKAKEGLHRYGLFGFCSPTPQLIDQATFITMACDEIAEMKLRCHNPLHTIPPQTTEHQSSPSSEGDDT